MAADTVFLGGSIDGKFTVASSKAPSAWIEDSSGAHLNLDSHLQQAGMAATPAEWRKRTTPRRQSSIRTGKGKVLVFPTEWGDRLRARKPGLRYHEADVPDKGKHTLQLSWAPTTQAAKRRTAYSRKSGRAAAVILESIRPAKSLGQHRPRNEFLRLRGGKRGADQRCYLHAAPPKNC